ncbi:globin-coupled sensor protein [Devosia submarina]|uniref:globin-coupled sensor protein n=1 Tax=Devosia submarina TaxID=1173082 RepID=UPI000D3B3FD7|nr:globin-coupled sensor protein [Devosia submarina]
MSSQTASFAAKEALQSRLDFIGLDEAAQQRLCAVTGHIQHYIATALDTFYEKVAATPETARFFDGKGQMDRAKFKQVAHWTAIASGQLDDQYFEASARVGLRHAQIGLEPRWHIGGYGLVVGTLVRGLVQEMMAEALAPQPGRFGRSKQPSAEDVLADAEVMGQTLADVLKSMLLDVDIAVSAYFAKLTEEAKADEEASRMRIDHAVRHTGDVLTRLAQGDLTARVTAEFSPEFEQIKQDTNAVADRLADIIQQLQHTSRSLKTATGEILAGANDLSERTTRQAATIEQTSAAVEQLSGAVQDNARRAAIASRTAQAVSSNATEGGAVMEQANGAMDAIEASSGKISNIIGLIDDIAFQTNLLALNASVEAARAGDAGKGFAVVAVEVRRLAQSAAAASAEVKQLVETSATEVRSGSRLVGQASEKLLDILSSARESSELINSIAAANQEQASSLDELATAIKQMDEMTQHNAALVEETNAAIEQTEAQAAELDQIIEVFQTGVETRLAKLQMQLQDETPLLQTGATQRPRLSHVARSN